MVKQNLSHTMFFVLGVLAIFTVLKYNINETVWHKAKREIARKRLLYKSDITIEEVENFMRLWPDFCEIGRDNDFIVSSHIEHPENMINWRSKIWFIYHYSDPARFFYVQQRIEYLLNAIEVRRNAKALIDRLSRQVGNAEPIIQEMIEAQKKRYENEKITPGEQQIMNVYEEKLRDMLVNYPFANLSSPNNT